MPSSAGSKSTSTRSSVVRNAGAPFQAMLTSSTPRLATASAMAASPAGRKRRSAAWRFARRPRISGDDQRAPGTATSATARASVIFFPVALHDAQGEDVQHERHAEEHQPEREGRERLGAI